MTELFHTVFYEPLYNGLIFLVSIIPGADIGIAVIILTLVVKLILSPISHKGTKIQRGMKELEPELKALQENHKNNKEELARKTMELYKERGVNPFSGCLPLLVQIPIIIALYWVFYKGLSVAPEIAETLPFIEGHVNGGLLNTDILYSFVHMPEFLKTEFLGIVDMTAKSLPLALLAGITQYYQMKFAFPDARLPGASGASFKEEFAKGMAFQMRYVLPVFVAVFAYNISAAVALYWVVSNTFAIAQERFSARKKMIPAAV